MGASGWTLDGPAAYVVTKWHRVVAGRESYKLTLSPDPSSCTRARSIRYQRKLDAWGQLPTNRRLTRKYDRALEQPACHAQRDVAALASCARRNDDTLKPVSANRGLARVDSDSLQQQSDTVSINR